MPVPGLVLLVVTLSAKPVVPLTVKYSSALAAPTVLPKVALPVIANPSVPAVVPSTVLLKVAVLAVNAVSAVSVAAPTTSMFLPVLVIVPPRLTAGAVKETLPVVLKLVLPTVIWPCVPPDTDTDSKLVLPVVVMLANSVSERFIPVPVALPRNIGVPARALMLIAPVPLLTVTALSIAKSTADESVMALVPTEMPATGEPPSKGVSDLIATVVPPEVCGAAIVTLNGPSVKLAAIASSWFALSSVTAPVPVISNSFALTRVSVD